MLGVRFMSAMRFYSAVVESAMSAFSNVVRLSSFAASLRAGAFPYGDLGGERGTGNGVGGAACALLQNHSGVALLSAGSTLGLNVEAALRPLFGA